jgi:malonyl CoA-acyl carrier protein transacylase
MEKETKKREILSVEILYDDKEDLNVLTESEDFHKLLFDEVVSGIEEALETNFTQAKIIYIPNLECSVIIYRRNFKTAIEGVIRFYEQQEDYKKCAELVKLKNRINGTAKGNKGNS